MSFSIKPSLPKHPRGDNETDSDDEACFSEHAIISEAFMVGVGRSVGEGTKERRGG